MKDLTKEEFDILHKQIIDKLNRDAKKAMIKQREYLREFKEFYKETVNGKTEI